MEISCLSYWFVYRSAWSLGKVFLTPDSCDVYDIIRSLDRPGYTVYRLTTGQSICEVNGTTVPCFSQSTFNATLFIFSTFVIPGIRIRK